MHRKLDLLKYQDADTSQIVFLTQGFGEGIDNGLALTVCRFEPEVGDRTAYFWTDSSGELCSMEVSPYFISNIEAARQSLREFIHNARSAYKETLLADSDPFIRLTFQAALTYNTWREVSIAIGCEWQLH